MNAHRKLRLGSVSTVAAAGAVVLMAAPAAAETTTTVTPSENLTDGQLVEVVVDSGIPFNPNSTADVAHVKECSDTASGIQCMEVGTLLPDNPETMNRGEYVWGGVVRLTQLLLLPSGDAVVCHGTNCFVRVFGSFDNGTDQRQIGTDVPVAFIGPK